MDVKRSGGILGGVMTASGAVMCTLTAADRGDVLMMLVGICLCISGLGYLTGNWKKDYKNKED